MSKSVPLALLATLCRVIENETTNLGATLRVHIVEIIVDLAGQLLDRMLERLSPKHGGIWQVCSPTDDFVRVIDGLDVM